jgi:cysteine synthase A
MLHTNITGVIGDTPMVQLSRFAKAAGAGAIICGKLEAQNPLGSVKDRIAMAMLDAAEREGKLQPPCTLVEPTSGNTGIGLAAIAAARGYKIILTMPETMSIERRQLLAALGAEVVLTEGAKGMRGAIARALEIIEATPGAFMPSQFENVAGPAIHYATTGPEIWESMNGSIDALVSGVGTGGTITGAGRFLREKAPDIRIFAVEPADSPVLSHGAPGPHRIQGIGAGFVPQVLDTGIYNEVIRVQTDDAIKNARLLARTEGILAGISSGAALTAALEIAARPEFASARIAVVLPDTGERYLSMGLFGE